jgi:hypothetical protein
VLFEDDGAEAFVTPDDLEVQVNIQGVQDAEWIAGMHL